MGKEESSFFNPGEPLLAPMGDEYCLSGNFSTRRTGESQIETWEASDAFAGALLLMRSKSCVLVLPLLEMKLERS